MAAHSDADLQEIFDRATNYVRSIVGTLDSGKLLYFYARFKQVSEKLLLIKRAERKCPYAFV